MPIPVDRVQVLKQETTAGGGNSADSVGFSGWDSINETEDALSAAGLFVQRQDAAADEAAGLWRNGNDLVFFDPANPAGYSLTQLTTGGGGISATQHKALRDLVHFIEAGPADGFTSGAYEETTYSGPWESSVIWYTSSAKTHRIVALDITRNANQTPNTETWRMYDTDGSTVLVTLVDTFVYSGVRPTSRTRTWS